MKRILVLTSCALSVIVLHTALSAGECPFKNKGKGQTPKDSTFYERLSACGCGGGGGGGKTDEIPPDRQN